VGDQETLTNAAAAGVNAPSAAMPIGKKQIGLAAFIAMSAGGYLSCVFKEARLFCHIQRESYQLVTKEIVFPCSLSL
jgi:hypothetical protein